MTIFRSDEFSVFVPLHEDFNWVLIVESTLPYGLELKSGEIAVTPQCERIAWRFTEESWSTWVAMENRHRSLYSVTGVFSLDTPFSMVINAASVDIAYGYQSDTVRFDGYQPLQQAFDWLASTGIQPVLHNARLLQGTNHA